MKHYRLSLWHPWTDKPGQNHVLTLFNPQVMHNVDTLIQQCSANNEYCFCTDILDPQEIPYSTELVERVGPRSTFADSHGHIVALRLRHGRSNGYLIPGRTWGKNGNIGKHLLDDVSFLFKIFNFEALSPSALSEKVLRSTLPERLYLQRPDVPQRFHLIDNHVGGRIDKAETAAIYRKVYEYDESKSYLDKAQIVPCPFRKSRYFYGNHTWQDAPTAFLRVHLTAHGQTLHPLQITSEGQIKRPPKEGEQFWRWLWKEELMDCLEAGYTLNAVEKGYAYLEMSTFMQEWIDILWEAWEKYQHPTIKTMMVGLPGRFLRKPETYLLIPIGQARPGDTVVTPTFGNEVLWALRTEPQMQSAQLTFIGSYIPMLARQNLYHVMKKELARDNRVLRSYIDNFVVEMPAMADLPLGILPGLWKEKEHQNAWIYQNQIISNLGAELPGQHGIFRQAKIDGYKKLIGNLP